MPQAVKSIQRAFKIMEVLASSVHGMGVLELARKSSLPGATVHRILRTLLMVGYVKQDHLTERYSLTMKMFETGVLVFSNMGLHSYVIPALKELTERVEEASSIVLLNRQKENFIEDTGNIALHKPVRSSSGPGGIHKRPFSNVTNGSINPNNYAMSAVGAEGPQWVEVDLGAVYPIDTIVVWHFYSDDRKYKGNKVAVSATGEFEGEEVVIFDSDVDGEYAETAEGKRMEFDPVEARYVRNWLSGSNASIDRYGNNTDNHWVEIMVYQYALSEQISKLRQDLS